MLSSVFGESHTTESSSPSKDKLTLYVGLVANVISCDAVSVLISER